MIVDKQITVHAIKCDVCGILLEWSDEDSSWVEDTEWLDDEALKESGWEEDEQKDEHYCPDHWEWSDDDEIIRKEIVK